MNVKVAQMRDEVQAGELIEQNLQWFERRGVPRRAGDLAACLRYRAALSPEDQQLYDDLLSEGNYAGSAAELLEIHTGRLKSQETPTSASGPLRS